MMSKCRIERTVVVTTILLLTTLRFAGAQSIHNDISKVKAADHLYFYGYDFSHVKVVDEKRKGQDFNRHTYIWELFLNKYITAENMAKKLRKESITFNLYWVEKINGSVISDSLWSPKQHTISSSKIPGIVAGYDIDEKNGIGFVVIAECMNEYTKKTSLYFTFFDIATREVLWAEFINSYDGNSYNRIEDWAMGVYVAYKSRFVAEYKKYLK